MPRFMNASVFRIVILVALAAGIYFAGSKIAAWAVTILSNQTSPNGAMITQTLVLVGLLLYILFLTIPFMPAIELGLFMMAIMGPAVSPYLYASTLIALLLSFMIGRAVPIPMIAKLFSFLHLNKARTLILEMDAIPPSDRIKYIHKRFPTRLANVTSWQRYMFLALLLNFPGNAVIGGGGGIGFIAGASQLYTMRAFLMTCAIAVAPIPFLFFFFG